MGICELNNRDETWIWYRCYKTNCFWDAKKCFLCSCTMGKGHSSGVSNHPISRKHHGVSKAQLLDSCWYDDMFTYTYIYIYICIYTHTHSHTHISMGGFLKWEYPLDHPFQADFPSTNWRFPPHPRGSATHQGFGLIRAQSLLASHVCRKGHLLHGGSHGSAMLRWSFSDY